MLEAKIEELKDTLEELITVLKSGNVKGKAAPAAEEEEEEAPVVKKKSKPAAEEEEEEAPVVKKKAKPAAEEEESESEISKDSLRKKAKKLIAAGGEDKLGKLLAKYGTETITDMDEEHHEAFDKKLDALLADIE